MPYYREEPPRISILGWIVMGMALISLMVVLFTSYKDRQQTECQADVNQAFYTLVTERAAIADGDRTAIRDLVDGLVSAKNDTQTNEALLAYEDANARLDKIRATLDYPDESDVCN